MNVNKLRGHIVAEGHTITSFAKLTGIERSAFYRKLGNKGETFTIKEANAIVKALNLTKEEASAIFFADYVA